MKIAIFTDTFLPQINGVVTATIMLATEMTRRGHEVHVLAPEYKEYTGDASLPFPVQRFRAFPAFFYEDFKWAMGPNPAILAYILQHKFHVIHFQTPMALGFQAILIGKLLKKPVVGTFHTFFADPDYLKHIKLDNKFVETIGWFYSNMHYNRCDLVTVPSRQTAIELKNHGCKTPISYISNGIDLSQFDNTKADSVKKELGLKETDISFLYVGRLAYEKNIKALIRAFTYAAKKDPRLKLLIVGGGPQEAEYKKLVQEIDTTSACIFLGKIEHNDLVVSGIFGVCSYFITLSKTENQPVTILEAQANSLIPICLPEKGLKTMLDHKKTGYFLKSEEPAVFSDDLFQLLQDTQLQEKMRMYIHSFIKRQEISSIAGDWERLYTDLILRKTSKNYFHFSLARLLKPFRGSKVAEQKMLVEEQKLNLKASDFNDFIDHTE